MRVLICSNQICINLFQSFIINVLYSTHIEKVFFVIYIIRNPFDYFDFKDIIFIAVKVFLFSRSKSFEVKQKQKKAAKKYSP